MGFMEAQCAQNPARRPGQEFEAFQGLPLVCAVVMSYGGMRELFTRLEDGPLVVPDVWQGKSDCGCVCQQCGVVLLV